MHPTLTAASAEIVSAVPRWLLKTEKSRVRRQRLPLRCLWNRVVCAVCLVWSGWEGDRDRIVQPCLGWTVWGVVKGFSAILGLSRFGMFNKHPSEQGRLVLVSLYAGTALFCSQ